MRWFSQGWSCLKQEARLDHLMRPLPVLCSVIYNDAHPSQLHGLDERHRSGYGPTPYAILVQHIEPYHLACEAPQRCVKAAPWLWQLLMNSSGYLYIPPHTDGHTGQLHFLSSYTTGAPYGCRNLLGGGEEFLVINAELWWLMLPLLLCCQMSRHMGGSMKQFHRLDPAHTS